MGDEERGADWLLWFKTKLFLRALAPHQEMLSLPLRMALGEVLRAMYSGPYVDEAGRVRGWDE